VLFYAIVAVLLGFLAVAVFHELIPGLCTADDDAENDCPFCKLVHTFALIVLAWACPHCWTSIRNRVCCAAEPCPQRSRYPHYLVRAPPAH